MAELKKLISTIVEGMQEKKAKKIAIVDMSKLEAPCQYFVICEGDSSTHVMTVASSPASDARPSIPVKEE